MHPMDLRKLICHFIIIFCIRIPKFWNGALRLSALFLGNQRRRRRFVIWYFSRMQTKAQPEKQIILDHENGNNCKIRLGEAFHQYCLLVVCFPARGLLHFHSWVFCFQKCSKEKFPIRVRFFATLLRIWYSPLRCAIRGVVSVVCVAIELTKWMSQFSKRSSHILYRISIFT